MTKELLMGNQAIALGAIRAGVGVVTGYPGTPSTEILETVARHNPGDVYVEWSVNEKSALEVASGAALAGTRTMVTMKQVGLNVASDPLMSLAYIGVKGGMVVVVADDPGPISSQTEQDTRQFGVFSRLPVFDPSSPDEAYEMIQEAFELSEKYGTPVILRPTTRVCHASADLVLDGHRRSISPEGFQKDPKWVIFPRLSFQNHTRIEERNLRLSEEFSVSRFNALTGSGKKGIVTHGINYAYTREALLAIDHPVKLLKIGTSHPFPEKLALDFLQDLEEVLVIEELSPYLEKELLMICGKYHLPVRIRGKLTGDSPFAGENTVESVSAMIRHFLGLPQLAPQVQDSTVPLPIRPPVLCAGCPHRASFYAVKQAMKGRKAVFTGDIGCYTLGNAKPLEMVDTCLCMGAGVTMAQGLHRAEPDTVHFAFIGDSTFFHTGIPGVVNALYNETPFVLVVLDNATTAMTGNQPHPGTGKTMMGTISEKIDIAKVLAALGVESIQKVNPFQLDEAKKAAVKAADFKGVSAIIFEAPCIQVVKPQTAYTVNREACKGCRRCIRELGCPAMAMKDGKAVIDAYMCSGCSLCAQVCPFDAIGGAAL